MASGAGQSAVVSSLLDHGADVHAGTVMVGDCSTALGVCTLVLWLSSFLSILTLLGRILEDFIKRCRVPPFLSTQFILVLTSSSGSNRFLSTLLLALQRMPSVRLYRQALRGIDVVQHNPAFDL